MPLRPRNSARGKRGALWRQWTLWIYFPLALAVILGGVSLWKSGRWLVASDRFDKVAWAVVLAGEGRDAERSDAALKLYMEGRIDTLIYSGCRTIKTRYASEFMADYLAKEGYPSEKLFEFRQDAYSTQEEAALLVREFRQRNLDTVLIITANFHTARTRRIFRELAQGYPHILVHSAEFKDYDPAAWWSSRESQKWWLVEWLKTASTFFELINAPAETGKAEVSSLINHASGPVASPETLLPPSTQMDSLAAAALDSASRPDTTAASRDSVSHSTVAGDTALPAPDSTEKTGKAAPSEKAERSAARDSSGKDVSTPKEPSTSKVAMVTRDPAPKKEVRTSTKDSTAPKTASTKSTASTTSKSTASAKSSKSESSKSEPASKSSSKKSSDKTSSKSSEKEKDKKKSGR